jgi:indole-3-glycerol phosphate synthase
MSEKITPLTKQQAAIVSAYTGLLVGNFSDMHKYAEAKFNRPILTHEFASEVLGLELKRLTKADFILLSPEAL